MSDENTPKLRLRPKLAGGPPAVTPPAPVNPNPPPPVEMEPSEDSPTGEPLAVWPADEPKRPALRPKLTIKPEPAPPAGENEVPAKAAPLAEPAAPAAFAAPPAPVKPVLVPRVKPTLSVLPEEAKAAAETGATPPFAAPAPGEKKLPGVLNAPPPKIKVAIPNTETWPAILDAPPPAGLSPVAPLPKSDSAEAEPAEVAAIRKASTFPFPQPTAKFPPLPGLSGVGGSDPAETVPAEGFLKKLLLIGGAVLLLLIGGAIFAYFKFFAKPHAKAPAPVTPVATQPQPAPATPAPKMKQVIDKVQQEQMAPLNEVVAAEPAPAAVKPAEVNTAPVVVSTPPAEPVVETPPPPVVAKAPPPPPPSMAFKAWVINLKIRGVRGGDAQRVFIEKTSYVPGEVVNQQLGIIFVGYDEGTRLLTFKDKTGATFERRN